MATDLHRPVSHEVPPAAGGPAAVRVAGLTRAFGGRPVIDGLDRDIEGTVLVPRRKAVAFQAPRLMPWKKVWRNVLLGLPGKPERAVAEQVNADSGIGFLMVQARDFLRTDVIVVCLIVYAFLGQLADFIVRSLERLLLQWRPTFTGR